MKKKTNFDFLAHDIGGAIDKNKIMDNIVYLSEEIILFGKNNHKLGKK